MISALTSKALLLGSVVLAVSGCSSLGLSVRSPGIPSHPWADKEFQCKTVPCTQGDASRAIAIAQDYCIDLRGYYQRGGQITGSQRLFVGVLGSLAGSVFSITAGGSASKAWAGLSGATNGLQTQLDQAAPRQGGAKVIRAISASEKTFAARAEELLAAKQIDEAIQLALLQPGRCSADAGQAYEDSPNALLADDPPRTERTPTGGGAAPAPSSGASAGVAAPSAR